MQLIKELQKDYKEWKFKIEQNICNAEYSQKSSADESGNNSLNREDKCKLQGRL